MIESLIVAKRNESSLPVHIVNPANLSKILGKLPSTARDWVSANNFKAEPGSTLNYPDKSGKLAGILFGKPTQDTRLGFGDLVKRLPTGKFFIASGSDDLFQDTLAFALASYSFDSYKTSKSKPKPKLVVDQSVDFTEVQMIVDGVEKTRDLINTPAIDLGPEELAEQSVKLFKKYGGKTKVICGDALLNKNFPLIHAVGNASCREPRLIEMTWGDKQDPKVTLVGKGVCYDTGGLNLKPGNSMLLMKKDMGGAANVLGLSSMIMAKKLSVCLRVLIPAVENVIAERSFRPGDILKSRKGLTIEIGNTDAEGRLVLADALALADEESPELLIDMATLTGAARVALGPELPPFFTQDEKLASGITKHAEATEDPLWRMPLWKPYLQMLESTVADINNVSSGPFAGSLTAALFLSKFVENARSWVHFDIFGWNSTTKPFGPIGGEAQCIRALYSLICDRFGKNGH